MKTTLNALEAVRKACSPEKGEALSRVTTWLQSEHTRTRTDYLLRCWDKHKIYIWEHRILWNQGNWVLIWSNKFIELQEWIVGGTRHDISMILESIQGNVTGLNHLGICYHIPDNELDWEIRSLVKVIQEYGGDIYRDPAWEAEQMEWLFARWNDVNTPMFEFVLPRDNKKNDEPPHFQIDLDTNLDQETLLQRVESIYWKWFFNWSLNIPEAWGVVVNMWTLDDTEWYRLRLWLWTKIRNREAHRESMEKIS